MKRRKELNWNNSNARHRAKQMVSMCLENNNKGSEVELLLPSEEVFELNGSLIGNSDSLRDFNDLEYLDVLNGNPNSLIQENLDSFVENSSDGNLEHRLTDLMPMLPENDYLGLLDNSQLLIPSMHESDYVSSTQEIDSASNSSSIIVDNNQGRLPVVVPETPSNSETDVSNISSESNSNNIKKRKKFFKYPKLTTDEKNEKNKQTYPINLTTCKKSCSRNCSQFSVSDRKKIWGDYWRSPKDVRLQWLARNIHLQPVSKQTTDGVSQRKNTRFFFLENSRGHSIRVCKVFFLNTLGFKNDSIITTVSKKIENCPLNIFDKRGSNKKPKFDTELIKEHIMRYKPCVAHYRRHNSPLTRYLNQDITLVELHKNYIEQYPNSKCCLEIYRRTLKEMHISLHRPQNDKCFDCEMFENDTNEAKKTHTVLPLKKMCHIIVHKHKVKQAHLNYKEDTEKESQQYTKIYSMDLEKSLLIPIIPDVKDCFFTSRLVVFNLTFAGLKKKDSSTPAKCILWHEATSGRDAKNIIDAIYKLILSERDVKHFVFWADNCTSQNKNWYIFTALVTIVNTLEIDSVTIKYLTKGHTHMTADGVHGNIEKNIRKQKYIYDFEDFKTCVATSRKNTIVIEVTEGDIYEWNKKRRNVIKNNQNDNLRNFLLKDVVEVSFRNGEREIFYKKNFNEEYQAVDFLQKKYTVHELPKKVNVSGGRGVKTTKKKEILEKLVPLMPNNRQLFWMQLKENSQSLDLIEEGEVVSTDV